jgi:acyl-coenzyme A thioesterase PaaI-like protein
MLDISSAAESTAVSLYSAVLSESLRLWFWARARIPMIAWVRPFVVSLDEERCEVRLPLSWRTRNHLGSMYFGALWTGADAAAAQLGLKASEGLSENVSFIFKDAWAEFLKRPEADVHFICEQGREIRQLFEKAQASGERENLPVHVVATVPTLFGSEPVARFTMTLSVKRKG